MSSFFRYCYLHCSKNAMSMSSPTAGQSSSKTSPKALPVITINGEEYEVISDYSWRNFFSSINFLKIMQKMTKHRSHRTCMLNQYKSSVRPFPP